MGLKRKTDIHFWDWGKGSWKKSWGKVILTQDWRKKSTESGRKRKEEVRRKKEEK